ncbi:STY4851/ECs_5259 family protein [Rhodocytophaga aerolata]|uniref:STY4851/ECs_5259 family protein n=1 Tax=Rhodocytophaga aerolata TaxID=455078 RepID=A0ABT8RGR4_9BACT|nr:STY4851/ECs_5259 family protein [Rhodocytophaga aerolata]MDO1450343.1 STY4851/ECs_5259 family protein [Rhodocytophaga aerolata]
MYQTSNKFITPAHWFSKFLLHRKIEFPDGRPLYQYRVNNTEYDQLQNLLKQNKPNHTNYQRWDACFVLYATEWWRRNYKEGHWTWDPIFESIRLKIDALQRNQLVMSGSRSWRRSIYKDANGHHDYLATIIIECGLPAQVLQHENHRLKQLIIRAYSELSLTALSENESYKIVEQIAEELNLPPSISKKGLYVLVAQMVEEAVKLKKEYNLGQEKSPTTFLDQNKPDWRESFPIQIDSSAGQAFLNELLTEVASSPEPEPYKISLSRTLKQVNDAWKIRTTLHIPTGIYDETDLRLNKGTLEKLSSKVDIELISSSGEKKQIGIAYKTQTSTKTGFKIYDVQYPLGSEAIYSSWKLFLGQPESEFSVELPLPGGEKIDQESPWIFVEKNETWYLKAQASFRTHASTAMIVANKNWSRSGDIAIIAHLDEQRDIYSLRGSCVLSSQEENFRITTSSDSEENYSYLLYGNTYQFSSANTEVYLGFPTLYKINNTTLSKAKCYKNIQVKQINGIWQEYSKAKPGIVFLRLLGEEDEVLFSRKIAVLPKDFAITPESETTTEGRVLLKNSSVFQVSILGKGISGNINKTEDGHNIYVRSEQSTPPKLITIALDELQNSRINLEIPFPSSGVKLFDNRGNQLDSRTTRFLDQIHGLRIALFNPTSIQKVFTLVFQLEIEASRYIRIVKTIKVDTFYHEVPVINFLSVIKKLFAVSDHLDAEVKITIEQGPSLCIKRYSSTLNIDYFNKIVSFSGNPENLSKATVHTFRLDEEIAQQDIQTLEPVLEDGQYGKWQIGFDKPDGKWIIFPGEDSSVMFRPKLFIQMNREVSQNQEELTEIHYIKDSAELSDRNKRIAKLTGLSRKIATDFGNSNWSELTLLWKHTKHLPLNTFDVWTAFSRSERALTALFFIQENELIERIGSEYPILWEAIPIHKWIDTARFYYNYLTGITPAFAQTVIENKLQYMVSAWGLDCLTYIIRNQVFGKEIENSDAVSTNQFIKYQINFLLFGEQGIPGLLSRRKDERWPDYLSTQMTEIFKVLPSDLQNLFPVDLNRYTKSVIYLPVLLAVKTIKPELIPIADNNALEVYYIREIQDFDREWFNATYDIIQIYYWINYRTF